MSRRPDCTKMEVAVVLKSQMAISVFKTQRWIILLAGIMLGHYCLIVRNISLIDMYFEKLIKSSPAITLWFVFIRLTERIIITFLLTSYHFLKKLIKTYFYLLFLKKFLSEIIINNLNSFLVMFWIIFIKKGTDIFIYIKIIKIIIFTRGQLI